jgi:hypothetical protein
MFCLSFARAVNFSTSAFLGLVPAPTYHFWRDLDWLTICPKDPKFKFGTYVFAIKAYASDIGIGSKSTLTMKAVDLPAKNGPDPTPTTCSNATGSGVTSRPTYRGCLRDGVRERYTMATSTLYYWTFPLPEKKCYPIYIESEVRVALWVREGDNATFPGAAILGAPPMFRTTLLPVGFTLPRII